MGRPGPRIIQITETVGATAVFLFFYQALRVLFSTLFGVIYDALFAEIVPMTTVGLLLVVVILALLTPLAAPRQPQRRRTALLVGAVLIFLARIPLTFNEPQIRLGASILIVAATGLYLATRLRDGPWAVVRGLILALVADQLLRAAGHSWDVTLREAWWLGQVAVSLILCLLVWWLSRHHAAEESAPGTRLGLLGGLAWSGWLLLNTSLLAFPNVVARWSGESYEAAAVVLLILVPVLVLEQDQWLALGWLGGLVGSVLLLGGLVLGYLSAGPLAFFALLLAQFATLILLPACFAPSQDGRSGWLRLGLAVGQVLFLVLSFGYAFTFTYAYTLDLFRGMGLPIILAAGLLVALPSLRLPRQAKLVPRPAGVRLFVGLSGIALAVLALILVRAPAPPPPVEGNTLRAATYNIHYGYDTGWHLSLEAQAQAIEASGAGVVALQEVDTGRATSYMIDNALWLSRRLGMEAIYLPCVEHLTGIALLSRYPVLDAETLLLPSELEQTGIIWAKLDVGGTPISAFAIWMGLEPEERSRQLDAALPFIAAHPGPAVFGGDFNSRPDSPVYARIAGAGLLDPFVALGLGSPPTDPAINPTKRIDFVWLRDLRPLDAQVLDATASDHRLVVVEAALP